MKYFVIILAFASFSQQCSDFIHDIHSFINTIGDVFSMTEANMRIQYNTIHADRVKIVATQMAKLKNMQEGLPENLCKYQNIEDSLNMLNIGQEVIGNVRKNLIYAVRASFEDMRNDHSNIIYNHLVMVQDFLEDCAEPSKSYFTDGKICVMALEPNIKVFLESSANKIIQCMKNATVSTPLQHPKFKVDMASIDDAYTKHAASIKRPFIIPLIIYQYSTKAANETAANNLFAVRIFCLYFKIY